ncbi:hypothetical protein CY35_05G034900 [Sphagnum magellanicum]|nr:hypothetical protein CY35_05G034900 [Sphagnum magellanicum]
MMVGRKEKAWIKRYDVIANCSSENSRFTQTVVTDLDGSLMRGNSFPYFMLLAFEGGGIIRATLLLLLAPYCWFLYHCVSEEAGIRLLIFVSFVGLREKEIQSVARAVLPKFYSEDVHSETWRVVSSFGKRYILTATPRIMVEPFAVTFLGVDKVLGTELHVTKSGIATGLLMSPGVLLGNKKAAALLCEFGDTTMPDVGIGDRLSDHPFLSLCKEGYIVPPDKHAKAASKNKLLKPVIFHDGRLVQRPTPLVALFTLLWLPIGFVLSFVRMIVGVLAPTKTLRPIFRVLGVSVIVKGTPPAAVKEDGKGILFVCTHRTVLDPLFLAIALNRVVPAATYSISRLAEILSPIVTVRLTRNRQRDAAKMKSLLEEGELVVCPEGTTCREPFLLRFSALFAELSEHIVPVAINTRMDMFYANSARGRKWVDPLFFFMNSKPVYEITFLDVLPKEMTCAGGMDPIDVANNVQKLLAGSLGFECTHLTRKEKYMDLCGSDGSVSMSSSSSSSHRS